MNTYPNNPSSWRASFSERRRKRRIRTWLWSIAAVIVLVFAFGTCTHVYKSTERTVTVHVTDKERVCNGGNSGCNYLVYTDHGTFKIADSHLIGVFWRTNSSDVYGNMKRDGEYRLKVIGFRFGFSSTYPNIVSATPVAS